MSKWINVLLIVVQIIYLVGCASEEVKKEPPSAVEKQLSCTFNQLDGECKYFDNGATLCSTGTCSEGDCTTGKGVITYPGGSKLEGIFKDGKLNGAGSYQGCSESFVGTFKNDFKEKGIFASKDSNKIYEGTFKDELKSGNFNVYLDYNQQTPFAENGKIITGVYSKKIVMPFIMDIDKNIYDSQERQRKEEEANRKRNEENNRKYEAQRKIEEAQENKRRQAEKAEERKIEAERKQIENSVNARKAIVSKAKEACEESRYEFSKECKTYETAKATYEKYKESICSIGFDNCSYAIKRRGDKKISEEQIRKAAIECNLAGGCLL
jgi:hypothetical protein